MSIGICIDLLRHEGLAKNRENKCTGFHKAVTFPDYYDVEDTTDIETEVLNKIAFQAVLDTDEMKVVKLFMKQDKVSLVDICEELGLNHR